MKKLDFTKCVTANLLDELEILENRSLRVGINKEEEVYVRELKTEISQRTAIAASKIGNTNKVIRTQLFTIKIEHNSDGTYNMLRQNDGFSIHELMGYISFLQLEIAKQMSGEIKPTIIKREVIVD